MPGRPCLGPCPSRPAQPPTLVGPPLLLLFAGMGGTAQSMRCIRSLQTVTEERR